MGRVEHGIEIELQPRHPLTQPHRRSDRRIDLADLTDDPTRHAHDAAASRMEAVGDDTLIDRRFGQRQGRRQGPPHRRRGGGVPSGEHDGEVFAFVGQDSAVGRSSEHPPDLEQRHVVGAVRLVVGDRAQQSGTQ